MSPEPSSLPRSATVIGYLAATMCANSANATAPVTISLTPVPDANSAPPVENWMMPSLPASAKPLSAASDRFRTHAVDGGERERLGFGLVKHVALGLWGSDGHTGPF